MLIGIILYGAYWFFFKSSNHVSSPKPVAIKVNKHSDGFNKGLSIIIKSYFLMKDALPKGDTQIIKSTCHQFISSVDSMDLSELKKDDSTILVVALQEVSDIKANAEALLMETDLTEMQQDFRMVSENLYPFFKTIGYEGDKLFWLSCSNAFGENQEGNWISSSKVILNPYQNKNNPKSSKANCGEVKDSIP